MNRISEIFEKHIEKLILGVVGLVCLWLLVSRVFISPNKVEYGDKILSPATIDNLIYEQAQVIERKLEQKPKSTEPNDPCTPVFVQLLNCPISGIDTNLYPPQPGVSPAEVGVAKEYKLPQVGKVRDVAVEHIRAVAYMPAGPVDEKNAYELMRAEVNDLDLVTVEAKFDVAGLRRSFYESFAGAGVQQDWRDPCLAKPVFAAVQLQRQQLNDDGTWSRWEDVPRTRIDKYKGLFEIIEDVQDLPPGGITVRMLQFDNPDVTRDLLQPEAYKIASLDEEWFTPALHKKFVEILQLQQKQARRQANEARLMRQREQTRPGDRRGLSVERGELGAYPSERGGRYGGYGRDELYGTGRPLRERGIRRGPRGRIGRGTEERTYDTSPLYERGRRTGRAPYGRTVRRDDRDLDRRRQQKDKTGAPKPSIEDIYNQLNEILLSRKTDLSKIPELTFWAHDDTVRPNKSYRYRIRIGVFNPVAGTTQLSQQNVSQKGNAILWSEFSNVTETVTIPGKMYFFASDIQEAAKTVTVEVAKYVLGHWYDEKFRVKQGEVIGKVKPVEIKAEEKKMGMVIPETVDYGTGAVLVDIMPVNDWTGSSKLIARGYYDMLYSFDGINIEHMPVKARYWSKQMQASYSDIQRAQKQPPQPLRAWGSKVTEPTLRTGEAEYEEYEGYEDFDALMEQMEGMRRRQY